MRRRFIADEVRGNRAALTQQNARHLAQVLRGRVGQEFEIAANGEVRLGHITFVSDERVEFELGPEIESAKLPPVTLVVAIFKFDRFEWAVEKATELGVRSIVPVIARRTEPHLSQAAAKRVERWRRIAHEASQQSRRVQPPEIADPIKLNDALTVPAELRVVCAESENQRMLRDEFSSRPSSVALAIGPEGGWVVDEVHMFTEATWHPVSLGPTILRAETAVIAALSVVNALLM